MDLEGGDESLDGKEVGRENSKQSLKGDTEVEMSTVVVMVVGAPMKVVCLTQGRGPLTGKGCSLVLFDQGLGKGLG